MSLNDDFCLQIMQQLNTISHEMGELKEMAVTRKEASIEIKNELHIVKLDVAAIKEWISTNKGWFAGFAFAMGLVGSAAFFLLKYLIGSYFGK